MDFKSEILLKVFISSLDHMQRSLDTKFLTPVRTVLAARDGIWAAATYDGDNAPLLEVGEVAIDAMTSLAEKLVRSPLMRGNDNQRARNSSDGPALQDLLARGALEWLVLHELMHFRLDHLDIMGVASLVETGETQRRSADQRTYERFKAELSNNELLRLRPCLELQADNDASDIHFGAFAEASWSEARLRATGAFMVMMLIERENLRIGAKGITHPKASTRFFQLAAQLTQFWLYRNVTLEQGDGESRVRTAEPPDDALFERYKEQVLEPVFTDALVIAAAVGAGDFIVEMSNEGALFRDIMTAQYAPDLSPDRFLTSGGQEWAELLPINEKIMAITGQRHWS